MKKSFLLLLLIVLSLSLLVTATACGDKECDHVVGSTSWQTTQASTCVATGVEEGICSICYETVTRTKPIDQDGHSFGEWSVSAPTRTQAGTASTTCTLCNHVYTTPLPMLSDDDDKTNYKSSSITTRPSPAKDGVRTYVYESTVGDVTFDVAIPSTGITSLRDAVEIASMDESKAFIRKATGKSGFDYYIGTAASGRYGLDDFSYEFGDNYTHIVDGTDLCERWYFIDTTSDVHGNDVFEYYGLTNYNGTLYDELNVTGSGTKLYLDGQRLYFQYGRGLGYFYGAESLLNGLYRAGCSSTNNDYTESIDLQNNIYSFSFGSLTLSGDSSQYFSIVSVEFSFSDSLTIENIHATCTTYINNTHSNIKTWEIDEETGYGYVIEGQELGDRYICEIIIDQTLKTEGDEVPQNPYSPQNMFLTSFEIYDSSEEVVLQQGEPALITANASTLERFKIQNFQPSSALIDGSLLLDTLSFYYRTKDENGNTIDTPIDWGSLERVGVNQYYNADTKTLQIKTTIAGDVCVVIKTKKNFEYELLLRSDEKIPAKLYPSLLNYASSGYMAQEFATNNVTTPIELAVGQPLYFKANVANDYESTQFVATVSGVNESNTAFTATQLEQYTNITEGHLAKDITDGKISNNFQYSCFEANTIGTYTVTMTSVLSKSKKATFKVKVVASPTVESMCASSYTQELQYPTPGTVNVSFALATDNDIPQDADEDAVYYVATVEFNGMTEYLLCKWAVAPSHIAGDNNGDETYVNNRIYLTTTHLRGVEQNFTIEWNEGYDIEISHPTGFGTLIETAVLTKVTAE